jgi:hypothetical protein
LEAVEALSESRPASESLREELEVEAILARALASLDPEEAFVLRLRYGVGLSNQMRRDNSKGKKYKNPQAAVSLGELARQMGTTPYKVSILEEKALKGLRAALRRDSDEGALLRENLAPKGFSPLEEAEMIGGELVVWPRSPLANKANGGTFFPAGELLGLPPGQPDGGFIRNLLNPRTPSTSTVSNAVLVDGVTWPVSPLASQSARSAPPKAPLPVLLGTPAENRAFLLGRGLTVTSSKARQGGREKNGMANINQLPVRWVSGSAINNSNGTKYINKVSKFKGVTWHSRDNKWQAQITVDGMSKHLGYFKSEEAAARKYDGYTGTLDRPVNFPGDKGTGQASKRRQKRVPSTEKRVSAFVGVHWDLREARWRTEISILKQKFHLGYFDNEEEAARAYDQAAAPHGRKCNFPQTPSLDYQEMTDEPPVNPASVFVGVSWDKRRKKWMAQIMINQKKLHLGYFESEDSAARAYDEEAASVGRKVNFPGLGPGAPTQYKASKRRTKSELDDAQAANSVALSGAKSSRFVGVFWARAQARWRAVIGIGGKKTNLGYFDSEEEAARAYDDRAGSLGRPINFM